MSVAEIPMDAEGEPPGRSSEGMARRVAGNSVWLIAPTLLLQVVSLLSNSYIARKLGAADFGQFNYGFAQIALFSPLCNLGLRAVAVRAVAEHRDRAREITACVLALRLLFTAAAAALSIAWLCLPAFGGMTRIIGGAAVLSMVLTSLGVVPIDLFQAHERPRLSAPPLLAGGLSLTVLSVAALAAGLGLPGFVAAYVFGAGVQSWMLWRTARRVFFTVRPAWHWGEVRLLLRQVRPFALLSLMSSATDMPLLDVIVLGAVYGAGSVGPYTAAIGLVSRLLIVPQGIADAAYPAVANGHREDRERVEAAVRRCITMLLVASAPLALCLTLTAPTVLWILYGDQYLSAAPAFRVAAWLIPLTGLGYLIRECLAAVHRQDVVVRLNLCGIGLLALLCWALIPPLGPLGAALAGVLREVAMLPFWLVALTRSLHRPVVWRDLARLGIALTALAAPFAAAALAPGHLSTVVAAAACFGCYGVSLLKLGLVSPNMLARRTR